jgi:sarcosine oxidase, subunit beta
MGQKDVLLLEQSRIASGASSKSNNIVECQFIDEIDILLRVKAFQILHRFFSEMAVPFHKIGYLRLTNSREDLARYEGALRVQRRLGIHDSQVLEIDEVKKMFPFLNVEGLLGAQYGPSDGKTDGERLTRAYARKARKYGVRFLEHTK